MIQHWLLVRGHASSVYGLVYKKKSGVMRSKAISGLHSRWTPSQHLCSPKEGSRVWAQPRDSGQVQQ